MIFELVREAFKNLRRHKLRSLLTMLGIIFGIASVIAMVSVGEGAKAAILAQISELGTRNIIINAKKPPEEQDSQKDKGERLLRYGLTFREAALIRATLPMVESTLEVHDAEKWIWFKSRRVAAKVRGVTPDYFAKLGLEPVQGRPLGAIDGSRRRRVCVVRTSLIKEAKYLGDPLKLQLKIGSEYFRVVGVLASKSFQSTNATVLGVDARAQEVYIPFETSIDRFGLEQETKRAGSSERSRVELHQIVCSIDDEKNVLLAARCLKTILAKLHKRRDYEMTVPLELLASRQQTQKIFSTVLPIIAGISLLVGGIGILNIMLASITERTREIGIRRALGATRLDITLQFLVETVTLSTLGGILGVALGVGGVHLLERFTSWQAVITPEAVAVSLLISCLTGVVFGLHPARRAAQMDPIEALRHD